METQMTRVEVFPSAEALTRAAAQAVLEAAQEAVRQRGGFLLCLAGGNTPRPLYELLAGEALAWRLPWGQTQLFFGDERCVPPTDDASNYRMVQQALLSRVPVPEANVLRIAGELPPTQAAAAYERALRERLGVTSVGSPARGFDLVLLGMGDDGHTASLFPGSVDEPERWASARKDPGGERFRVSLLPQVFDAARAVCFLVSGVEKSARVADVLQGTLRPHALPAQRIHPADGALTWMLDRAAAAALLDLPPERLRADRFTIEVHL